MIRTRVATLLRDSPPTVSPSTPAVEAAQRLRDPTTAALPVVDDDDAVLGIVTESNIVALVAEERTDLAVSSFMSTPPVTTPETTVAAAADRMRTAGVRHLPVVEDGAYCGLVGVSDLEPFVSRRRLDIPPESDAFTPPEDPKDPELQLAD